ncbi:hypothetical protein SuNHUV7_39370 (plasmid) [Pseudoseohaeicola sp. NH-UV-7]|uniref:hypothetical protein n=1 Tax=unclassified Sulfitobacter TaxID=196795 RepID=UPI000E0B0A55|nr:hypothetical protein [Sulfitobacter sp. JL08]AXI54225.1 hypothetical protein C1J05_06765 [Sulfitobacter sp. JL08]
MRNIIRIGVLSQPELPKQIEPMIETIFREQFRKLNSIIGAKNIATVSSVNCKVSELACICALEEGLNLELEPLDSNAVLDEEELEVRAKIHAVLEKQPQTTQLNESVSEAALIEFSDIIVLVCDRLDSNQMSRFDGIRELFLENDAKEAKMGRLIIDVSCPMRWASDADSEVYFDYLTRAAGQFDVSSEVEIPNQLIKQWKDTISAAPH